MDTEITNPARSLNAFDYARELDHFWKHGTAIPGGVMEEMMSQRAWQSPAESVETLVTAKLVNALMSSQEPPDQWRPIHEAPRDGTHVDLYIHGIGRVPDAYWEQGVAPETLQRVGHAWTNKRGVVVGGGSATHWRYPPPPPEPKPGGEL